MLHFQPGRTALAFTIAEEREVGETLLYTVRQAFQLLDDPDLVQYISNRGEEVLEVAGLQYFDYHFFIIKSAEFNAFAAPSGLVFFYSGLINSMNSEDEFISVLAHEIGHVAKRHLASRMEKGKVIGAASLAVGLAAIALGGGAAGQALLAGSMAAGQSANLHFSRKDEEEADLLAYDWMKQLDRNPEGQEKMLQTMRRISRYRSEKLPQYLLTHPNPEDRLDYVQALIAADDSSGVDGSSHDEFEFLRFKYRIMSLTDDNGSFRGYLAGVLSDSAGSKLQRSMAKYGLSQLERAESNHAKCLELLDEVMQEITNEKILLSDRGAALYSAGRHREAVTVLERRFSSAPADMYAALLLARSYFALGDMNRARDYFNIISYEMPRYSKVYFELGKIATAQGRKGTANMNLGKYYLYEGKLKLARFSLGAALKDDTLTEKEKKEVERLQEQVEKLMKK